MIDKEQIKPAAGAVSGLTVKDPGGCCAVPLY